MIKKNIPNLLTLCNLLCGCIAIVFAFEGNLVFSAYMVGICCVFDFLDGLVARALHVSSEIGKQLDSLADMVSFGVLPGVMLFQMIRFSFVAQDPSMAQFSTMESLFIKSNPYFFYYSVSALLIPLFSALRLAKFNLDTRQTDSFIGVPTPANTIFIASLVLIAKFPEITGWTIYPPLVILPEGLNHINESDSILTTYAETLILNPYFLIALSFISSISLIAPLPLFALKFKNFSWADNKLRYIFLALALALLIVFQFVGIPLIIILYIVLSVINNILTRSKTQQS